MSQVCRHPNCGEVESHFDHHLIDVVGRYQGHKFEPADDTGGELRKISAGVYTSDTKPHRVDEARIADIINRPIREAAPSADGPEWIIAAAREIHTKRLTDTLAMAHVISKHCEKPSADGRREKWMQDAFVILAGLKEAVQWELAPAIMKEIRRLVDEFPAPTPVSGEGE